MDKARLREFERVLSNLHIASLAIGIHRDAHRIESDVDGEFYHVVRDKKGKPLLDSVDGVVVLNDDVMYDFTQAVKAYDSLKIRHRTRKNFSCDLVHGSYENVRSFYYSEEYSEICHSNDSARRQVA